MISATILWVSLTLGAGELPKVEPPPPPDFAKPVDYVAWYRRQTTVADEVNAVNAYASFLYDQGVESAQPIKVADDTAIGEQLMKVLANPDSWTPDKSEALAQWVSKMEELYLEPFMDGMKAERFALRWDPSLDFLADRPLPPLANGRVVGQMMFARAWRLSDRTLYVNNMVEAVGSTAAYGCHLSEGLSVYEQFIGAGIRDFVCRELALSLGHRVRLPEHWVEVVRVFEENDQTSVMECYARSLCYSEAAALQLVQHFFPATKEGDQPAKPTLDLDRIHAYFAKHRQPQPPDGNDLERLAAADPNALAKAISDYYSGLRDILRAPAILDLNERLKKLNEATFGAQPAMASFVTPVDLMLPSYVEQEATRRMLHLFLRMALQYKQTGEWPASLDELKGVGIDTCRIDPFSGEPFKIHYFPAGPALYSVGPDGKDDRADKNKDILLRPKV